MPHSIPEEVEAERLKLEYRLAQLETQDKARTHFIDFVRYVWPQMIVGEHHKRMASMFDRIADGTLKRLIINLAPRHTKSEMSSYLLPAFLLGRDPRLQIIQATHTAELAVKFGRKVRDLVDDGRYQELFPEISLKQDSKAAGRWDTNKGGTYYAAGVGGALTGRGADLCVDPAGMVETPRGRIPAGEVVVGDRLLGVGGYNPVRHVIWSEHKRTVLINGAIRLSVLHPVWVEGRGWVDAEAVCPGDILRTPGKEIYNSSTTQHGLYRDEQLQSGIQHLGADASAVFEPQRSKLHALRRSWDKGLRAVGEILQLYTGHGSGAFFEAYVGPEGQRWGLHAGELSLVGSRGSAEQPTQQCFRRGVWGKENDCSVGAGHGPISGHDYASNFFDGYVSGGGVTGSANVAHSEEGRAVDAGWAVSLLLRLFGRRRENGKLQPSGGASGFIWESEDVCWIPLAVRSVEVFDHEPRRFVNFHVENSNTFVYESILTHNCIIDDPHSEQDAMSELALNNAWEWYQSGPRTRLQPGGAVVVVMTRWGTRDLTAQLLKAQSSHNADKWEVIEFPAILPSGKPLWPEFWKLEELLAVKASLSVQKWNAMYQQQPTNDEGAILKREWWRVWPDNEPPAVEYIIQTMDTAYSKKETADFSVITTWGVFYLNEDSGANIILLDVKRGRWDFPELKRVAKDEHDHWQPDNLLIEAKATGITLQQELRRMNVPVTMYSPGGRRAGQDKVSRANSVAPILESGIVWAPDTDWAEELVEECAAFPNGDNDDMVDVTTMALMRFRQGNFISLHTDDYSDSESTRDLVPEYY